MCACRRFLHCIDTVLQFIFSHSAEYYHSRFTGNGDGMVVEDDDDDEQEEGTVDKRVAGENSFRHYSLLRFPSLAVVLLLLHQRCDETPRVVGHRPQQQQ